MVLLSLMLACASLRPQTLDPATNRTPSSERAEAAYLKLVHDDRAIQRLRGTARIETRRSIKRRATALANLAAHDPAALSDGQKKHVAQIHRRHTSVEDRKGEYLLPSDFEATVGGIPSHAAATARSRLRPLEEGVLAPVRPLDSPVSHGGHTWPHAVPGVDLNAAAIGTELLAGLVVSAVGSTVPAATLQGPAGPGYMAPEISAVADAAGSTEVAGGAIDDEVATDVYSPTRDDVSVGLLREQSFGHAELRRLGMDRDLAVYRLGAQDPGQLVSEGRSLVLLPGRTDLALVTPAAGGRRGYYVSYLGVLELHVNLGRVLEVDHPSWRRDPGAEFADVLTTVRMAVGCGSALTLQSAPSAACRELNHLLATVSP